MVQQVTLHDMTKSCCLILEQGEDLNLLICILLQSLGLATCVAANMKLCNDLVVAASRRTKGWKPQNVVIKILNAKRQAELVYYISTALPWAIWTHPRVHMHVQPCCVLSAIRFAWKQLLPQRIAKTTSWKAWGPCCISKTVEDAWGSTKQGRLYLALCKRSRAKSKSFLTGQHCNFSNIAAEGCKYWLLSALLPDMLYATAKILCHHCQGVLRVQGISDLHQEVSFVVSEASQAWWIICKLSNPKILSATLQWHPNIMLLFLEPDLFRLNKTYIAQLQLLAASVANSIRTGRMMVGQNSSNVS